MAEHVCPVWVGYLLASPLRKLIQNPRKSTIDPIPAQTHKDYS